MLLRKYIYIYLFINNKKATLVAHSYPYTAYKICMTFEYYITIAIVVIGKNVLNK